MATVRTSCASFVLILMGLIVTSCGDQVVVRETQATCGNGSIEEAKLVMMAT